MEHGVAAGNVERIVIEIARQNGFIFAVGYVCFGGFFGFYRNVVEINAGIGTRVCGICVGRQHIKHKFKRFACAFYLSRNFKFVAVYFNFDAVKNFHRAVFCG